MSRSKVGTTSGTGSAIADGSFPFAVVKSRWLLVLAVSALVAFGSRTTPTAAHYAMLAALLVSNGILALLRSRLAQFNQTLEVLTVGDVLIVSLIIGWIDPSPQLYVAVFAALMLAMVLGRVGLIMLLMVLLCGVYAGYLYTEIGANFWRQVPLILRVPFLYAVGLHFATIASFLKTERAQRATLVRQARQLGERADHLSKEQDRLRALSQIGRLGLTAAEAVPVRVLLEMAQRAQHALGASRCSLVLFAKAGGEQAWNGRTKDRNIEVRTLQLQERDLTAILPGGKVDELRPGESKDLMASVQKFFPDSSPFGSLLAAPIKVDGDGVAGALFLIDDDHLRAYSEGERDFFGTVSLMTGAFIQARERLENEVRLRTLINAAPVIMFALRSDETIVLFEGRASAVLKRPAAEHLGHSICKLADNPEETREAFEQALAGHLASGTLSLEGTLFETQYSPLRGVDGEIAGVMGVTTAVLEARQPRPTPAASPRPVPGAPPGPVPDAPPGSVPVAPPQRTQPSAPAAAPETPSRPNPAEPASLPPRADPYARREGLKPMIPLADEGPDPDTH